MKAKSTAKKHPAVRQKTVRRKSTHSSTQGIFPIVGIGASAGGLEALEQFLKHVPADSGMAFVIVQHLDPTRKGIMPELLQRVTAMNVVQVKDRTRIKPDCVYVIPPNKDMSVLRGVLHLFEPSAPRGLRLPIDFFLRSLALDRKEHSIGVILSGMGSDGTLGLRAIKEKAGVTLVQAPSGAKFDSMPRSAIDAGLADITAPADELPLKIIACRQRTLRLTKPTATPDEKTLNALAKVVLLLRDHSGHDFSLYKKNTLYRRIERRMSLHQINTMPTYIRYLQDNPQELDLLFKELLIGVTNFFRDPAAWVQLREEALPALLAGRPSGQNVLRAWVPGCSTGEEAYSLAIVMKEAIEALKPVRRFRIQIFATDLDRDAIDRARTGIFPENIASDVAPERLNRFFSKDECGYRVGKEIRETVIFAPQDLIMDPPFTKLDILSCRNLLIYLTTEVQKKLIPLFHYSLNPGGILFLGSAETTGTGAELFTPLSGKHRLYQRSLTDPQTHAVEFPSSFGAGTAVGTDTRQAPNMPASLQALADQMVLQRYASPAALTNDKGDILYISGKTGKYLEPAAGKANWNIFAMAREGLRYELAGAFQRAVRKNERVALHGLKTGNRDSDPNVDITVELLDDPGPLHGLVMIVFTDAVTPAPDRTKSRQRSPQTGSKRLREVELELQRVRDEACTTHEEMQTSQEELRSANEELQSTNEELQSTNEELTTSKEEMQSLNEELQTLNAELQSKLDELSRAGNDMKNLLDSTDIATLFLDKELNVRRYTPLTTEVFKLIPGDVGRPISDLVSNLRYPELHADTRTVLRTLTPIEKAIATENRRWFTVRIMPYRTQDDRIDGVVITFNDITVAKKLEARLRERQTELEKNATGRAAKTGKKKISSRK